MSGRRGLFRGIYSVLVDDPDFRKLSPIARHVLLTMRVSKEIGIACIWLLEPVILGKQTGLSLDVLEVALTELEQSPSAERPWLYRQGDLAWLRNGLKHDPSASLQSKTVRRHLVDSVAMLPACDLLRKYCRYYDLPYPHARGSRRGVATLPDTSISISIRSSIRNRKQNQDQTREATPPATPEAAHPPGDLLAHSGSESEEQAAKILAASTGISLDEARKKRAEVVARQGEQIAAYAAAKSRAEGKG